MLPNNIGCAFVTHDNDDDDDEDLWICKARAISVLALAMLMAQSCDDDALLVRDDLLLMGFFSEFLFSEPIF